MEVLLAGELSELGSPRAPPHRILRKFDPPARLLDGEQLITRVVAISATVGESRTHQNFTIDGRTRVAHMLRDALTDGRVWFADNGRTWATD